MTMSVETARVEYVAARAELGDATEFSKWHAVIVAADNLNRELVAERGREIGRRIREADGELLDRLAKS